MLAKFIECDLEAIKFLNESPLVTFLPLLVLYLMPSLTVSLEMPEKVQTVAVSTVNA